MKWYILGMTAIGIMAFVYRTLAGSILIRTYRYRVLQTGIEGGDILQLYLAPIKEIMSYKPGQFVFVRFLSAGTDGISQEWHPFSISSSPNEPYLRLSIKALGDYTHKITGLRPDTVAEIEGAYGRFSYTNVPNRNQIWVAGGIGITPFLSMARTLQGSGYTIDLYYSVKTESEVIDWQMLYDTAIAQGGTFRVFPFIAEREKGFLSADYIEARSGSFAGKDVFVCGPPPMMQSIRKQLREKGVPGVNIHSEEFAMS